MMIRRFLCSLLRRALIALGDLESDDALRARTLGVIRRQTEGSGTRSQFESAIEAATPVGTSPEFYWDSPIRRGDRLKLTVIWR